MRRVPKITAAELEKAAMWAVVDAMRSEVLPARPPNSFTVYEYAAKYGLLRKTAEAKLRRDVDLKKLSRVMALVTTTDGRAAPTVCYSPCK